MTLALGLAFCTALAGAGQAREGLFVGAGVASQSPGGDLDGTRSYQDPNRTVALLAGTMGSGTGYVLAAGYGFGKRLGIEYEAALTNHTASHAAIVDASPASLASGFLALRGSFPLGGNVAGFIRAGYGQYTAKFDRYALTGFGLKNVSGYTGAASVKFSGAGLGYGAGVEVESGKLGVNIAYTRHDAQLNHIEGGGMSGTLPTALSVPITALTALATYHF
jgi:hypothetical protein